MSKINIRESLNRLDLQTDNKYDLLNTFNSKKLSDNSKKKLAEAIENNSMASVNRILHESEEQLYKVVISSGATKRNFESALYEDEAEEIVDYYGGRWIDENGFEWDMYVEEDDDSTEHAMVDNSYDMEDDDERAQREYVESLNEAINAKDSMVAQEFNYTMQYGDQSSDVSAAVIIIPGGLMINGEPADLTVYAEDENGEVINFKSVEEANDWINKYKDDVEFHIEQGNELHATPSAYYNSFDESLENDVLKYDDEMSDTWADMFDIASPKEVANTFGKNVKSKNKIYRPSKNESFDIENLMRKVDEYLFYNKDAERPKGYIGKNDRGYSDLLNRYGDYFTTSFRYVKVDDLIDYAKKHGIINESLTEEVEDEQLYKVIIKNGSNELDFESNLSYEDAQDIVDYYNGRWIDEEGYEWSMEIEEDDESTERVYPFDESLNEDASKPDFVVGFYAGQVDDETLELINPEKLVKVNVSADELKERYGKEAEKLLNDYTVQTADRLKNSSGMLQQMILQTAEQKAIYAHRLFSKFDEVKDRLGSNTYMDRKIEEINYPFRDGIKDLSKKLGKMLLPKRENLNEAYKPLAIGYMILKKEIPNHVNYAEFANYDEVVTAIPSEADVVVYPRGGKISGTDIAYWQFDAIDSEGKKTKANFSTYIYSLKDFLNNDEMELKLIPDFKLIDEYPYLIEVDDDIEESLTEGIEDLYSISSTKAKDMTDEDFKVLKPLVDEYLKDRKALGTWPDSVDERNFVKKWYRLADKCKEIAKNGMQGITGYGRLNDFIKIKILELARSVDNTFPWYVRNQLEKFGELDESLKEDIEDEKDFEYDDSDEVEEGVYFFVDGENYAWVERIAGPVYLDFDNWAVWSAREIVPIQDFIIRKNEQGGYDVDKDAYIAAINSKPIVYFVVDEDTGFIDWGPVENQTEAQDFLNGKISDWEEETGFRHPMHNDFFDESLKESRAIKNDDDFEITLHYDDIGNGKEYDYKLGYDEVVDYLREIAWSNGDGPEDANEDEYLEWVMDSFDELADKYESYVLNYFKDEASQYEYDHRDDEP